MSLTNHKDGPYYGGNGWYYFSYQGITHGPFRFWQDACEAYDSYVSDCQYAEEGGQIMKTDNLLIICSAICSAIVIFALIVTIKVSLTASDLICRDLVRTTEHEYTMLDCHQVGSSAKYNLVVTLEQERN